MACDPQTLANLASCIECNIPPGSQLPVLIALWCQIQNNLAGFTSALFAVNGTTSFSAAHGLAATPSQVRAVLVTITNDANTGLIAGDEIALESVMNSAASPAKPPFVYGANATNVFVGTDGANIGNEANYSIVPKAGGVAVHPSSWANFNLKIYAKL